MKKCICSASLPCKNGYDLQWCGFCIIGLEDALEWSNSSSKVLFLAHKYCLFKYLPFLPFLALMMIFEHDVRCSLWMCMCFVLSSGGKHSIFFCPDISKFHPKFTQLLNGNVVSLSKSLSPVLSSQCRGDADVFVATSFACILRTKWILLFFNLHHTGFFLFIQIDYFPLFSQTNLHKQNDSCTQMHTIINMHCNTHTETHLLTKFNRT